MSTMTDLMLNYLIPIAMVFFFAMASAIFFNREEGFNNTVLMVSMAIGIGVLVWIGAVPIWFMTIAALLLLGVIFSRNEGSGIA